MPPLDLSFLSTLNPTGKFAYFYPLDMCHFYQNLPSDWVIINKGLKEYYYANLYEAIVWYVYYSSKYQIVMRRRKSDRGGCQNRSYFGRIPSHYRGCDPKKGLNIVKEAITIILKRHSGLPKYWNPDILQTLFTLR